jgi:triosephosphate isomerase (TIM)
MDKKIIIGNWKMNPQTWAEAQEILESVDGYIRENKSDNLDLVICPPFVFLEDISKILNPEISLGAQDIFWEDAGSDTGEISGPMLAHLNVRYVIVGHSERRWKLGEDDDAVNKKLKAVLRNGMVPIVCLGEKYRDENYKDFLREQTEKTFIGLSPEEISKCLIAYEPVWAISTSPDAKPDTPESALESILYIKEVLKADAKILYGGSVNSDNAKDFLSQLEISGVLVGSASLKKEEFTKILSLIK